MRFRSLIGVCLLALLSLGVQRIPGVGRFVIPAPAGGGGEPALNCADATTRCVPSEHATVDACWTAASAGDICWVSPDADGIYPEAPAAAVNGTSGNPITILADGAVTLCGIDFSSNSYIRVIGFVFDGDASGCSRSFLSGVHNTNTGLEYWNNTFRDEDGGIDSDIEESPLDMCNACIFIGNTFSNIGTPCSGVGAMARGNDQLWAYNAYDDMAPDAHFNFGARARLLNEYQANAATGCHSDYVQYSSSEPGLSFLLVEGYYQVGDGASGDEHAANMRAETETEDCSGSCGPISNNVFRRNVLYSIGSATWNMPVNPTDGDTGFTPYFLYNDTHVDIGGSSPMNAFSMTGGNTVTTGYIFDVIYYHAWGPDRTTGIVPFTSGTFIANRNLAFDPDGAMGFGSTWTNQANEQTNVDPEFVDYANQDFTLQATSDAIGTGGAITTTSGSGTGTTFSVATGTGGAFRGPNTTLSQYGGKLTDGDVITVGTDACTIASISGDDITCEASFTWGDAEGVFFGTDTTPDLGALPYKAGGYTLTATYTESGGTTTITPNDADLVRFVICYNDDIPITVDNRSPYTCSTGSGVRRYDVYKRYASVPPLWVTATEP